MKKYFVSITETLTKVVSVNAESVNDAIKKVRGLYEGMDITLDDADYIGTDIKLEDDQDFWRESDKKGITNQEHFE